MAALQDFSDIFLDGKSEFSKLERIFLDASLLFHAVDELMLYLLQANKSYFQLLNLNKEKMMNEINLVRWLINDIINTEQYTLAGIALYTRIPEDTLFDVAIGVNNNPSLMLTKKILELHRMVRPEFYQDIIKNLHEVLIVDAGYLIFLMLSIKISRT